jgi:hypothetical protein
MNTELKGIKKEGNYRLYYSPYVELCKDALIDDSRRGFDNFNRVFNYSYKGTTGEFRNYNLFSLTAFSIPFYTVYRQIVAAVRDYVGDGRPLWMQCWMNYHQSHEVLPWHHHMDGILHGYLSIDPKDTVTEFTEFSIENKVGLLYLGNTGEAMAHRVVVRRPYVDHRVTIAFDVLQQSPGADINLSFIPVP